MPSFNPTTIHKATFEDTLKRYDTQIPEKLQELEKYRMYGLPAVLKERKATENEVWMEKEELVKLVEWKLYVDLCSTRKWTTLTAAEGSMEHSGPNSYSSSLQTRQAK
jgi:hypothetical protein